MAEYTDGVLNRERLRQVFVRRGVDPRCYDFDGSNLGEQYVMERLPGGWSVYYSERGGKNDQMFFDTEDEACHELMHRVLRDPTTRTRTVEHVEWALEDGVVTVSFGPKVLWSSSVEDDMSVATLLSTPDSDDAIVLLDPDRRPSSVERWHPFPNVLRLGPTGEVRWRADPIPGDPWKCFLSVEWEGDVLRARGSSHVCTLDPETGGLSDISFTK